MRTTRQKGEKNVAGRDLCWAKRQSGRDEQVAPNGNINPPCPRQEAKTRRPVEMMVPDDGACDGAHQSDVFPLARCSEVCARGAWDDKLRIKYEAPILSVYTEGNGTGRDSLPTVLRKRSVMAWNNYRLCTA